MALLFVFFYRCFNRTVGGFIVLDPAFVRRLFVPLQIQIRCKTLHVFLHIFPFSFQPGKLISGGGY